MTPDKLFIRALTEFDSRAKIIQPEQWDLPTPDTEWTVRDLLNHVAAEDLWAPHTLAGKTLAEVGDRFDGDVLGTDPLKSWQEAANASKEATLDARLDRPVHLSSGQAPAGEYLTQMFIDHLVHAWDLATAIKASTSLDPDLVQTCYQLLLPQAEGWRQSGAFGPTIDVRHDADIQTKLLALTGRKSD